MSPKANFRTQYFFLAQSQFLVVHKYTFWFFTIHFNIILPGMYRSSKCSLRLKFTDEYSLRFFSCVVILTQKQGFCETFVSIYQTKPYDNKAPPEPIFLYVNNNTRLYWLYLCCAGMWFICDRLQLTTRLEDRSNKCNCAALVRAPTFL